MSQRNPASVIVDLDSGKTAKVLNQNALLVAPLPLSSKGIASEDFTNIHQLSEFFKNDLGDINQIVSASIENPVEFSIASSSSKTKWISGFRVIIDGNSFNMSGNGARGYGSFITGLTNGIQIQAIQGGSTIDISLMPIKRIIDFLNYSDSFVNFIGSGSGQQNLKSDYLQFVFKFEKPIVLASESADKLKIMIQDDLTDIVLNNQDARQFAIAFGYQEIL